MTAALERLIFENRSIVLSVLLLFTVLIPAYGSLTLAGNNEGYVKGSIILGDSGYVHRDAFNKVTSVNTIASAIGGKDVIDGGAGTDVWIPDSSIWIERVTGESNFKVWAWLPKYLHWYRYAFGPRIT